MGKRGPPPKPSALKKLQGTFRADRAARHEWQPPPGAPERPSWLDKEALSIWDRIVPALVEGRVVTQVDGEALSNYCTEQALVRRLQRMADKGIAVTPTGEKVAEQLREAKKLVRVLGACFGLDPSSRSKLDVGEESKTDPVEKDLFGPGKRPRVIEGGK